MKKTIKTTFTLLLTAFILAGLSACWKKPVPSTTTTANETETDATIAISTGTVNETAEVSLAETPAAKNDSNVPAGTFKPAVLIKLGEHTYYPEGLFNDGGRNEKYKDYMISQLEKADKDLHDDIYVHGIGEAEERNEYRFFAFMMKDGVIYENGYMTCWYVAETKSNNWDYDSSFRRTDFSKSGLLPAEGFFGKVYEKASKAEKITNAYGFDGSITGTYLLEADSKGNLFYRFTINKFSTVDVDAKTGEIIKERYWDGVYT